MKAFEEFVQKFPYIHLVYLSLALVVIYTIVRYFIIRKIENSEIDTEEDKVINKRRVNEYGKFILFFAIISLWFSQLQNVFVSLLVFASAIVLAFKEVIMCITGGFLIRLNKHFKSGDRIEISGIRGFVLEKKLTGTKLLELGPEKNSQQTTGNIITIPNSLFLSNITSNQSYFQDFSIRSFIFSPLDQGNIEETEEILLDIANKIAKPYLKRASDSISRFCKREGIIIPTIEPRVKLLLSEANEVKLLLKLAVDNKKIAEIEQRLFREFLTHKKSK